MHRNYEFDTKYLSVLALCTLSRLEGCNVAFVEYDGAANVPRA